MTEKDLEKNLDNLIIDGLIKEAEQDNADFEAAMRRMSDEEFEELIFEPAYAYADEDRVSEIVRASLHDEIEYEKQRVPSKPFVAKKSKWQVFRPWITSAVAAAAVVLIVLIPSINAMNDKLCDSALYASSEYMTSSRSANEINGLSDAQLKAQLPEIEKRYKDCIKEYGKFTYYTEDLQEAGWDLAIAYLKLHKKGDAVKVLKVLSTQYKGTPFGDHCKMMLEQLS